MTMRMCIGLLAASLSAACTARPQTLGMLDRKLTPCPAAPHCVSTQARKPSVEPAPYRTSREEARQRLAAIIRTMPGAKIVTEAPDYIHAEFTSPTLHYVDDLEVYLDDREKVAHFRSSSRSGFYDFGANNRRVKRIRQQFVAEKS
jgi:uncharacterized protein (DUF1499 family)